MQRKVFLAVPSLTGQPRKATETTIECFKLECAGLGWELEECRWVGDSIIAHARNVLAAKFLRTQCTDIFWLDDDVASGPGAFTRLMTYPVELVCGVYRVKAAEERYPVRWLPDRPTLWADPATGLLEAQDAPLGFCRMRRSVVERMAEAVKDEWFFPVGDADLRCVAMFNTEFRAHEFWGEDFYFCRRWRELGGQVWLEPEMPLQHISPHGQIYAGKLGDWLRQRMAPAQAQPQAAPPAAAGPLPAETLERLAATLGQTDYAGLFAAALGETPPAAAAKSAPRKPARKPVRRAAPARRAA